MKEKKKKKKKLENVIAGVGRAQKGCPVCTSWVGLRCTDVNLAASFFQGPSLMARVE